MKIRLYHHLSIYLFYSLTNSKQISLVVVRNHKVTSYYLSWIRNLILIVNIIIFRIWLYWHE